jgi:hypothetical protein
VPHVFIAGKMTLVGGPASHSTSANQHYQAEQKFKFAHVGLRAGSVVPGECGCQGLPSVKLAGLHGPAGDITNYIAAGIPGYEQEIHVGGAVAGNVCLVPVRARSQAG